MTPRRLLPRVLFLIVVLALFGLGGYLAWLQSWRTAEMLDLAARSEVVTLPAGNMEFAVRGSGRPVLVLHSAPGGYDQALALGGFLEEAGFQIVAPSRPGYLRTPLSTGATPESQAGAAAELLDQLGIFKAAVVGFGWGGPAAVEFARRFPDRASALVLVSTPALETPPAPGTPLPQAIAEKLGGDAGSRSFVDRAVRDPGAVFDLASTGDSANRSAWVDATMQNPGELERFQDIILSLTPLSCRKEGLANDLAQPLASIRGLAPPVLFVVGGMDKVMAPGKIDQARLSPAELFVLPQEGHLVLLGRGDSTASKRVVDFLDRHSPQSRQGDSNDGD